MNTYNTCIKPIEAITGRTRVISGLSAEKKQKMISRKLNPSRYEFLGFLDRSNEVVLRPRFHNVRNSLGQFAAVEE